MRRHSDMLKWISKIFFRLNRSTDHRSDGASHALGDTAETESIWTLCGNIDSPPHGTKYFYQGAKVYCFPPKWGDGYENIMVIGRHKKSKRYMRIIMPSKRINNWRLKRVYDPYVVREMKSHGGWDGSEWHKERIEELRDSLLRNKAGESS